MKLFLEKKKISDSLDVADSTLKKGMGLRFAEKARPLLFEFEKESHPSFDMWFVNFTIDVVYLDSKKKIVDLARLKPWTGPSRPEAACKYVVELPAGWIEKFKIKYGKKMDWK